MTAPRLDIDLDKIHHNASLLVHRLAKRGISVTGVVKSTLGCPEIANTLLRAGVLTLGDSRLENIEALRHAGVHATAALIRSPMPSQAERVVRSANFSFNTEIAVIRALSRSAQNARRTHGVVLMVELGDLREGIMPADLHTSVRETLSLPNIALLGIGTNLSCRSGVVPDDHNMAELSTLANSVDAAFSDQLKPGLAMISGGNSANLRWALGDTEKGRINNLRLGESILLGCETLHRQPLAGLHTDAISLVAEVIELKTKPSKPWGTIAQNAFGEMVQSVDRGRVHQAILAIGRQDVDPDGLIAPSGVNILAASSDHLVAEISANRIRVGAEIRFGLNYSALLRAMTSPFVSRAMKRSRASPELFEHYTAA